MDTLLEDNIGCLWQGVELLEQLGDEDFKEPSKECFKSTIGGHLRHNTDHYECFLRGYQSGRVDYDARNRDDRVESDREFALRLLRALAERLRGVPESSLDDPLLVKMDAGKSDEWSTSSVRRELQFLLSHTVHHYALVATIARLRGFGDLPDGFGVAPSTLKHRQKA